ncbi:hypothetical protein D3C80_1799950 [compost metagenome]
MLAGLLEQVVPLLQGAVAAAQPHQRHHLLLLVRLQVVDDRLELGVILVILVIGQRLQRPVVARAVGLLGDDDLFLGVEGAG